MKSEHMAMLTGGKVAEVIPLLEAELKVAPDDRQKREDLALAYSQAERFAEAVQVYEDILHVFPDDPRILVNVGFCYSKLNRDKQAFDAYTKVIDQAKVQTVEPEVLSLAWTNLAAFYEHYKYYEDAYVRYRMSIQVNPENWLAKKYLKQLEELADPEHGPIGIRRLPDGREQPALWDGCFINQNRSRKVEYGG